MIGMPLSTKQTGQYIEWNRQVYYFHTEFIGFSGYRYYINFDSMTMFHLTDGRMSMVTYQMMWDSVNRELYVRGKGRVSNFTNTSMAQRVSAQYEQQIAQQILD